MRAILLDLAFLEFDVLARHRVVLFQHELLGHGARVLLGHVEIARVGGGIQPDFNGCRLGHESLLGTLLRAK